VLKDCPKSASNQVNYIYETVANDEEFKQLVTYKISDPRVDYSVILKTLIDAEVQLRL